MAGRSLFAGMAALAMLGTAAFAQEQESTNRVAAITDWSVFAESYASDGSTTEASAEGAIMECWAVSAPKESVNTRDGRVVAVRRGDILLFATFRPSADVSGEIAFTGGYPFAEGSTVSLEIDDASFELFTEGEWAWPASASDDIKIATAMKRGTLAILTGRSSRGTVTKDSFSLLGFTAALENAEERCAS